MKTRKLIPILLAILALLAAGGSCWSWG